MKKKLLAFFARTVAPLLVRLYFTTVRIIDDASVQPSRYVARPHGIYPFWHNQQLCGMWHYRHSGAVAIISRHRDGAYIAMVAESLGVIAVRGSSSRGGTAALKELVALAGKGHGIAVTPDGPRGPRYTVKEGILYLAQKSRRPIKCFAIGLSDYWALPNTWDGFRVPKPFARGVAVWSEPIHVPPFFDDAEKERLLARVRDALMRVSAEADRKAYALKYPRRAKRQPSDASSPM